MEGPDRLEKNGWCRGGTSFSTAQATQDDENKKRHGEDSHDDKSKNSLAGSIVNTTMKGHVLLAGNDHRGDESTAKLQHVLFSTTTRNGSRGRTISISKSTTTATEPSSPNSSLRTKTPIWTFDLDSVQPCTEIVSCNEKTGGEDDPSFPPSFDEFFDKNKNGGIFSSSPTCAEDIDDVLSYYILNSLDVKSKCQQQQDEGGRNEPNNSTNDGQQYRTEEGGLPACSRHDETTPKTSNRRCRVSRDTSMTDVSETALSAPAQIATDLFGTATATTTTTATSTTTARGKRLDTNVVFYDDKDGLDALMFVGKRIEVQWKMSDGRREWFAGTVSKVEQDGRTAFINYDDGDVGSIQNGTHPQHDGEFQLWRTAISEQPSGLPTTNLSNAQQQVQQRKVYRGWTVTSTTQSGKKKKKKNKDSKNTSESDENETGIYESSSTASEYELEVARRRRMKRQKYGTKWVCRRWPPKCLTASSKSSK